MEIKVTIKFSDDFYYEGFSVSSEPITIGCCLSRGDVEEIVTLIKRSGDEVKLVFEGRGTELQWENRGPGCTK